MAPITFKLVSWIHVVVYGMVFLNTHGLDNLAKKALAWQSSANVDAGKAVDGLPYTDFYMGSCSSTQKEPYPWWIVDLGSISQVEYVTLLNRDDCCSNRTRNFTIEMSTELTSDGVSLASPSLCYFYDSGQLPTGTAYFTCPGVVYARYVKIQLHLAHENLTLCEVEVYGTRQATFYELCPKRFEAVSGKLSSSMILDTIATSPSVTQCVFRCHRTKNCHSMNVQLGNDGVYKCQLLEDVGDFSKVHFAESWLFYKV